MKKILLLPLTAALALAFTSCGKQESEAERKAAIDREAEQRLEAEHQTEEKAKLAQQQADLEAREAALAAKENQPAATATPAPAKSSAKSTSDAAETGTYATFYRRLDPYGDWMETSNYGYVFQPRQAAQSRSWRPYTDGHWVYTDAGWTWISAEKFGWATYHYGRWIRLREVGWVWVPGEQWAPAWVSWRKGNDYVGWAPLPPDAHFDRQTGIHNWADNYYDIGPEQYAFVPAKEFGGALSIQVIVPTERNVTIINQTTNVTNITYHNSVVVDRGPSYDDLRARSRHPIERLRLERTQNFNEERPVIRGEVVAMPAPDFRPAQPGARPQRVQRKIQQPKAERGWEGIRDTQAAQKARAKMQSEATPPPNLPPKKVVTPAAPAPTPAPKATPAPTPAPKATPAPTRPVVKRTTPPPAATARPAPTRPVVNRARPAPTRPIVRRATPAPTATQTPSASAAPSATPTASPASSASPSPTASASPSLNPKQEKRQERLKARRAEKRKERQAEKAASPTPSETPLPGKKNRRPGPQPNQP